MRDKLKKLMEREGFILILFLCVCVVAGGTLYISMRNINQAKNNLGNENFVILEGDEEPSIDITEFTWDDLIDHQTDLSDSHNEVEEVAEEIEEVVEDEEVASNDNYDDEEALEVILPEDGLSDIAFEDLEFEDDEQDPDWEPVDSKVVQTFTSPIEGEIITEYTSDSLVYSETLEAWVGHGAIDIKANEGEAVKAAGDGIVKEVYEDELWGIVIVIDHGEDLLTRYSNLSTKDMVKVGLEVKKGDHISKVGNTAKIEMLMEPHLHFEVIKNGNIVDPRSIMD